MDNNAQNPPAPIVQDQVVPAVDPIDPPTISTGSMHKEAGPTVVEQPFAEVLQSTEQAPILEAEVAEVGVEVSKNPEIPDLTLHDKNAGISHAPVIAPVPTTPTDGVQLPMTETQALETLKKGKNVKSGKSWIAIEVLKMIHRKLLGGGEH